MLRQVRPVEANPQTDQHGDKYPIGERPFSESQKQERQQPAPTYRSHPGMYGGDHGQNGAGQEEQSAEECKAAKDRGILLFHRSLFCGVTCHLGQRRSYTARAAPRKSVASVLDRSASSLLALPMRWYLPKMPAITHFECSRCRASVSAGKPQTVCPQCAGALYVRYDLRPLRGAAARQAISKKAAASNWSGMWRYAPVLPEEESITLGDGWTPMLRRCRYPTVFLKEEGANPTGSFKARGLALAVTMAAHYGLRKLAVPAAGKSHRGPSGAARAPG